MIAAFLYYEAGLDEDNNISRNGLNFARLLTVKALRLVPGLPEARALAKMNPENLSVSDGVLLIGILTRKATENNQSFGTSAWTPRKIDMVLWTYGR